MIENRKGFIQPAKPDKIKISPELERVQTIMPIDPADRENLKKDIEAHGIREPLKVYENGGVYYLLAGKNRLDIALEIGLPIVNVEILRDLPPAEREQFCIDDNLNRRHLTADQKIIIHARRYPDYYNAPTGDTVSPLKVKDIAKATGQSERQVQREKEIYQDAIKNKGGDTVSPLKTDDIKKARNKKNEIRRDNAKKPKLIKAQTIQSDTERNPIIEIDHVIELAGELVKMIEIRTTKLKKNERIKAESFIVEALKKGEIIWNAGASLYAALEFIKRRRGHFDKSELSDISKNLCNITRELLYSLEDKEKAELIKAIKAEINAI